MHSIINNNNVLLTPSKKREHKQRQQNILILSNINMYETGLNAHTFATQMCDCTAPNTERTTIKTGI